MREFLAITKVFSTGSGSAAAGRLSAGVETASHSAVRDLFILFKPGIVGLVLVSTLTGAYLAGGESLSLGFTLLTLFGVGLATAGSAALNNYFDRDIDALMKRTSSRALVTGSIHPSVALASGLLMVVVSMLVLSIFVSTLSALLTLSSVILYVVVYAMILKRRSSWANQIGGIAGALPPVIGFTAAGGALGAEAFSLFFLVAVWQQPHALSLALKYRDDYKSAGIPVVPVACGVEATKLRIFLYSVVLLPVSILPYMLGMGGVLYLVLTGASGLIFIALSGKFLFSDKKCDIFLFLYSVIYLTVVFLSMVIEKVV